MTLLGDFPVLRLGDGRDRPPAEGFARERWGAPEDAMAEAHRMAGDADAVLVVAAHVLPGPKASAIRVEKPFLKPGKALGFPARAEVTGLFVTHGAVLIPAAHLQGSGTLPEPALSFPYSIGQLSGNATPESAFGQGFLTTSGIAPDTKAEQSRLALAASLGTEALNGGWWVLGALSGLQKEANLTSDWSRHEDLLANPRDTARRIATLSRHVRLETGLPVRPLSHAQSRALKAMLPSWPASDMWERFVRDCVSLDPKLKDAARANQRAACRLWTDMAPLV